MTTGNNPEYLLSERPAIRLFRKMGYNYYDGAKQDERDSIFETILFHRLKQAIGRLNPWISEATW